MQMICLESLFVIPEVVAICCCCPGCSSVNTMILTINNYIVVDKKKINIPELKTQLCLKPVFVMDSEMEMVCGGGDGCSSSSK